MNHDASLTLLDNNEVLYAGHTERYTGKKFDSDLTHRIFADCFTYGYPDKVVFFERPYLKKARQLYAGQYKEVFSRMNLPSKYLKSFILSTSVVEDTINGITFDPGIQKY